MRFAILSDLHANLEATEAVLADAGDRECTHYVCLGDVVGYNANPHEFVEIVRKMDCPVVKGNHDEQASLDESSRDGDWRAAYCIFHIDKNVVEQRRVKYDIAAAQDKIIKAGLPRLLAERLKLGR